MLDGNLGVPDEVDSVLVWYDRREMAFGLVPRIGVAFSIVDRDEETDRFFRLSEPGRSKGRWW